MKATGRAESGPFAGSNEMTLLAVGRLRRAVGEAAGERCADEVLRKLGRRQLDSADDLFDFASCLLEQGGATYMVGNALKVCAILRGARER